jgi:REP element-mobilizing transposase RayT
MKSTKSRKTIRLQGYDYAQNGWYFITICVREFEELLGEISDEGIFIPNEIGKIIEETWLSTPQIRPAVELDVYQVMPNHFHAIVVIGSKNSLPSIQGFPDTHNSPSKFRSPIRTIGAIVRGFKGVSTQLIRQNTTQNLDGKIWQRNYYERIIRDEAELNRIRAYIENNPKKWQEDKAFFKKLLEKMAKGSGE